MSAFSTQRYNAMRWLSRQLLNQDAAPYFDPLLEALNPTWVRGRLIATVEQVEDETHDTRTFYLRTPSRWRGFESGQHLSLTLEINGTRYQRTFSLACAPETWRRDGRIQLTVKRTAEGLVTPWMHHNLRPGSHVEISEAFGDFLLPTTETPLFYLAGGSGITPILAHLDSLTARGYRAPITLIYCIRSDQDLIGAAQLERLQRQLPTLKCHIIKAWQGDNQPPRLLEPADLDVIKGLAARTCYLCGPAGLMDIANAMLEARGVARERIHQTFFVPPTRTFDGPSGGTIALTRSGRELSAADGQSLLEAAEANGLSPRFGCRMGICHQCSCRKTAGTVRHRTTGRLSGPGEETIQLCVSEPQGPVTLDL